MDRKLTLRGNASQTRTPGTQILDNAALFAMVFQGDSSSKGTTYENRGMRDVDRVFEYERLTP